MASSASKGVYMSQLGNAVRRAAALTKLDHPGITPISTGTLAAPTRPLVGISVQGGTTTAKPVSAAPTLPSPQQIGGPALSPVQSRQPAGPAASTQRVQPPVSRLLPSIDRVPPPSALCPPLGVRAPTVDNGRTQLYGPIPQASPLQCSLTSAGAMVEGTANEVPGVAATDDARARELFAQAHADVARAGEPGAGDAEVAAAVAALDRLGACRVSVDLLRETGMGRQLKQMSKSCVPAVAHAAADVVAAFKRSLVGEGR
jgi:hypothetical protein